MTSVKEFRIDRAPTADRLGVGAFEFTDAYSVFDWGQMPDPIPDKGAALCTMGAFNFHRLEDAGIPTHYRGVIPDGHDDPVSLDAVSSPPTTMAIELTQVPELPPTASGYDYTQYHDAAGDNYLVPLEVVFRNRVPIGSSLRRRTTPSDHGLVYDHWPETVVELSDPIVEFSTKYEESDRYLDHEDAANIAGQADIAAIEQLARDVNAVVTDWATTQGFTHDDGKIEVLYHDGELKVADVVGTFDENRFAYDGQQLSKEVLRQYHRHAQADWVDAIETAKRDAKRQDTTDWRSLCDHTPEPLPESVINTARDMYASGATAYIDRPLFEAPTLDQTIEAVRELTPTR